MTLKQLQFFKKTAELENISKAADELFIAQPALSRTMRDLEEELGFSLFDRNGKRIVLNRNGEILYKHVQRIQTDFSNMEQELKEVNQQLSTSINVAVRVASKLLPDILKSFYAEYPAYNLVIYQNNQFTKNPQDFDVMIDSKPVQYPLEHNSNLLIEERIMLALPAFHPLAFKSEILLSDLEGEPCSLLNEYSSLGKMVHTALSSQNFTPKIIFESDNPHMIRDFLKLDLSYSFVPEKTWSISKDFPNLILKEVKDFTCYRNIYLSYGQNGYPCQASKAFVSHVKAYFREHL